jgi:uncharacterized protein YutE (UPF0331/DUF86 family)
MKDRIKDKIQELEEFLEEIEPVLPSTLEDYKNDFKTKAIGERYFEKIVEVIVDIAFLIIKEKNLRSPEEDKESFDILVNSKIISKELCEKLKDAKGMRNVIAHEYGKINDELVFYSLTEELIKDSQEFIKQINKVIR